MTDNSYFEVFRDERKFFRTSLYSVGRNNPDIVGAKEKGFYC